MAIKRYARPVLVDSEAREARHRSRGIVIGIQIGDSTVAVVEQQPSNTSTIRGD
ncbi:MAG: hypothetical protein U5L46_01755 [Agrobacterium sp.]|nr:hypothetical protein [Agrobacterium sp.]